MMAIRVAAECLALWPPLLHSGSFITTVTPLPIRASQNQSVST